MLDVDLTPRTLLRLAPGLRVRFDEAGHVLVDAPNGGVVDIGPRGFAALSLFSQPLALGDAIERLEADERRPTEFVPTLNALNMLLEEGALLPVGTKAVPRRGWANPVEHARMLHDVRRTRDYLAAIAAAVRPGDVVLDLGTGSGVLAVAAARAGARHVFAVEATDIADVAERVFAANGVGDRVTLIRGWSREIDLPERADLLVSEIIGSEPFEEEILETTLDARRRLVKPAARLVPSALTLLARPLLIGSPEARQRNFGRDAIARWRRLYDMEFQPLLEAALPRPVLVPTDGEAAARWQQVGVPVVLATIDLATFDEAAVCARAELAVPGPGCVNAVAITFRADLHGAVRHTFDPWRWPSSSWVTSVWVLPETLQLEPGEVLLVRYSRRVSDQPDGLCCSVVRS